jgi:NAD(P)-dependent dehydrogenase (short-subunit alcohol dehydrogenase family)
MSKLFDLSGRVALITGGSKGLGKAMAIGFAEAGADVVISSRHEDELVAAAAEIRRSGRKVAHQVADMTRRDDIAKLADFATRTMGRPAATRRNRSIRRPTMRGTRSWN